MAELDQMAARSFWDVIKKKPDMKTIGHWGVFNVNNGINCKVEKYKARHVSGGDQEWLGVDCTEAYTPTASLISLFLVQVTPSLNIWQVASFNISGAYLYSPGGKQCSLKHPPFSSQASKTRYYD
ncbi:hypothetical protein O181_082692 [Austropuccinia psidii MF-1]|uniref:Reverse transcriptase Ty1/copia-type domain-containing protein n=1 Tax=Austropuccinia psidii MF-1 TaxID=1389203 RepID=A0A9Q3FQY5_9BASI|nr:hypothetical protein [Austropuccinia psidii MF-1]